MGTSRRRRRSAPGPRVQQRVQHSHRRLITTRPVILHVPVDPRWAPKHVFNFLLQHVVPIDVRLSRFRVDEVADIHAAVLALAAGGSKRINADTFTHVRVSRRISRGASPAVGWMRLSSVVRPTGGTI